MHATKRAGEPAVCLPFVGFWPAALALGVLMALALPTEPLFSDNQNTKFLHGLAAAGYGQLDADWQANTRNGLPLFTALVEAVARTGGIVAFYVLQVGVFVALAAALLAWHRRVAVDAGFGAAPWVAMLLALALLHSNQGTAELFEGVAKQHIVGRVLEPANIGVLLVAGALALHVGRAVTGAAALAAAAAVHPGYVVPATVLLVAGLVAYGAHLSRRELALAAAVGFGGLALNTALLARGFPATSPALAMEAARILTEIRIPHHSELAHWFDVDAAAKLALVVGAVALTRNRPLGRFLAVALALTVALTLLTLAPGTAPLRLVAPWRTSVALVPIAVVVVLTYGLAWLVPRLGRPRRWAWGVALVTAAVVTFNVADKARAYLDPERPAHHAWVREHGGAGDVFLTPVGDQDFRLATGMPQYVSFKSHPYQDVEVLEWHRRVELAREVQAAPAASCARLRRAGERAGVTHVVWPRRRVEEAPCGFLERVYDDREVVIFGLTPER
jgi:hypothetical protein